MLYHYLPDKLDTKISPHSSTVDEGDNFAFECRTDEEPLWFFEKKNQVPMNSEPIGSDKMLIIEAVKIKNIGFYYCYGFSKMFGVNFVAKGQLSVSGKFKDAMHFMTKKNITSLVVQYCMSATNTFATGVY